MNTPIPRARDVVPRDATGRHGFDHSKDMPSSLRPLEIELLDCRPWSAKMRYSAILPGIFDLSGSRFWDGGL